MTLAMVGVIKPVMAVATIRLKTVPHAIGRILPLGLRSGMTRAPANASRVSGGTWLVAKSVRTSVRAWCVAGYEATTA